MNNRYVTVFNTKRCETILPAPTMMQREQMGTEWSMKCDGQVLTVQFKDDSTAAQEWASLKQWLLHTAVNHPDWNATVVMCEKLCEIFHDD